MAWIWREYGAKMASERR